MSYADEMIEQGRFHGVDEEVLSAFAAAYAAAEQLETALKKHYPAGERVYYRTRGGLWKGADVRGVYHVSTPWPSMQLILDSTGRPHSHSLFDIQKEDWWNG